MKQKIHPKYFDNCQVTCTCGNVFNTGSIKKELNVDICSSCHPFFTGHSKFVDVKGRIDKFEERRASATKTSKAKA